MTFSIVARSADGTHFGVAVASKFLAVGAAVPAAAARPRAVATQAWANVAYKRQALALLGTGVDAAHVVAGLTAADAKAADRQLGVVGASGDGATFTGPGCHPWAGGLFGDGYAIQGNILTGPEVVEAMRDAWRAGADAPFPRRLLAALRAGDAAGGDSRGRQSAALFVVAPGAGYDGGDDVAMDLRVDDHPDPCAEMARLIEIHELLFGRPDPATLLPLDGDVAAEVSALLTARGHAPTDGDVAAALAGWAGVANLEERMV